MVATRRRFDPNLQKVRILEGGAKKRALACTRCLKANKIAKAAEPAAPAVGRTGRLIRRVRSEH